MVTFAHIEHIATLVEQLPLSLIAAHGTADDLELKIATLLFTQVKAPPKVEEEESTPVPAPKKRGRPKGSKNKPKDTGDGTHVTPKKKKRSAKVAPKKQEKDGSTHTGRRKDKHTRKSKKSTAAAIRIQARFRGHMVRCE